MSDDKKKDSSRTTTGTPDKKIKPQDNRSNKFPKYNNRGFGGASVIRRSGRGR